MPPGAGGHPQPDDVLVVGSANMDLTLRVDSLPGAGATVLGAEPNRRAGGKGANQAVAAAAAGARVSLVACLGEDTDGDAVRSALQSGGVNLARLLTSAQRQTGLALILVDPSGENMIAVAPGANHELRPDDLDATVAERGWGKVVLTQLEISPAVAARAVVGGGQAGSQVVLNLSPAMDLAPEILAGVDVLLVNRSEAEFLLGEPLRDEDALLAAAPRLTALGPASAVVTAGGWGAVCFDGNEAVHVPAEQVTVVDTTGAGDAFAGTLAAGLSRDLSLATATHLAAAAGAAAVQRHGAQSCD